MFNLFCRTYTTAYCVLGLSYSLYIAATIYLLQVQAFPDDHQALQRLDFCLRGMAEIRQHSPVISGALATFHRELARLGLPLGVAAAYQAQPQPQPQPQQFPSDPVVVPKVEENSFYNPAGMPEPFGQPQQQPQPQQQQPQQPQQADAGLTDYLFQPQSDGFGPDPGAMGPGVFEAMSSLQPMSAWVGTINEFDMGPT